MVSGRADRHRPWGRSRAGLPWPLPCVLVAALLLPALAPAEAAGQGASWAWLAWDPVERAHGAAPAPEFLADQLRYARVSAARAEKRVSLMEQFAARGLPYPPAGMYLRVFKRERLVELWVRPLGSWTHELLKVYPMCVLSGTLGPKRRQGDLQVPEGFYTLDNFNPVSEYHLSLGISYPNRADRIAGAGAELGGDIFVHGGCKTIGCVPMTDEQIKELYWLAVETRAAGQAEIPIHIFPTRLDSAGIAWLETEYRDAEGLRRFWANLEEGYAGFQRTRRVPVSGVDATGRYVFGRAAVLALEEQATAGGPALLGRSADRSPVDDAMEAELAAAVAAQPTVMPEIPLEHGLLPKRPRAEPVAEPAQGLLGRPAAEGGAAAGDDAAPGTGACLAAPAGPAGPAAGGGAAAEAPRPSSSARGAAREPRMLGQEVAPDGARAACAPVAEPSDSADAARPGTGG